MTIVNINDKTLEGTTRIRDINTGELFRTKDGSIYVMTDEADDDDKSLAMLISTGVLFGSLKHFDECDKVTRLDGTISVTIN